MRSLLLQKEKTAEFNDSIIEIKNYPVLTPKISVIIPVYQEEKILFKILSQYQADLLRKYNVELIISDGGSKDSTLEIAKRFANKIVVHKSSTKQTIAEGRNRGAEVASGDILVFINGDTLPNNLEKFFDYVTKWALRDLKFVALAIKVLPFPDEEIRKDKIFYFLHNNYVKLLNIIGVGMGRGECQVVRRDAFWKVGGYNPKIVAGEDFDLYRRLAKVGKIKFVEDVWVYESPRRFRKLGYLRTILRWLLNGIFVMLFRRSYSSNWEPVR